MLNGKLTSVYGDRVISVGKNKRKIRFNYSKIKEFELLEDKPFRTKVLLGNDNMSKQEEQAMSELKSIYKKQNNKCILRNI